MKRIILLIAVLFFVQIFADRVVLKNGKEYANVKTVKKQDTYTITFEDGHTEVKNKKEVKSVSFGEVIWKKKETPKPNKIPEKQDKQTEKATDSKDETDFQKNDFGFYSPIGIGIWSPFSIDEKSSPKILQANLFYGKSEHIWGLNVGVGVNHTTRNMNGIQAAWIGNWVDGNATGLQGILLGIGNYTKGKTTGLQGVGLGIGNYVKGDITGLQGVAIGIGNFAKGNVYGAQIIWIGLGNYIEGNAYGVQAGAFSIGNIIKGDSTGLQFGLIYNQTKGHYKGWQIAAINYAGQLNYGFQTGVINSGDTNNSGVQLGALNYVGINLNMQWGAINVANESKGTQVGIINYTSEKAKLQLGVLNIALKNPIPILPIVNFDF